MSGHRCCVAPCHWLKFVIGPLISMQCRDLEQDVLPQRVGIDCKVNGNDARSGNSGRCRHSHVRFRHQNETLLNMSYRSGFKSRRTRSSKRRGLRRLLTWPFRVFNTNCNYCLDKELQPSRMRVVDLPFLLLGLRRFICPHCFHHFFRIFLFWETRCFMKDSSMHAEHQHD